MIKGKDINLYLNYDSSIKKCLGFVCSNCLCLNFKKDYKLKTTM